MSNPPVYRYYANPRFSVNQFTDYMATTNASQRDKIIQKAKFPASKPVTSYQFAKREIRSFLMSGNLDYSFFDLALAKLQQTIDTDEEKRDDARRDLRCVQNFIDLMMPKKLAKYNIYAKEQNVPLKPIPGLTINVRLDAALTETGSDGLTASGGIVLFTAATLESRRNIEVRRRQVTQLILWALEGGSNIQPLPRLCMSLDVFGQELIKAVNVSEQFRGYARDASKEAALKWDSIAPPSDYDGPNWKK